MKISTPGRCSKKSFPAATPASTAPRWISRSLGIACGGWCPRGRVADDGVLKTLHYALKRHRKPALVLQLHHCNETRRVRSWLRRKRVRMLNVAGPRERKRRGIYREARRLLRRLLAVSRP